MTFTNSILAGTTLVRESISSEGYVAGTNGWQIERDGTAEFNEVTIRGDITIENFLRIIGLDPDAIIEMGVSGGSPVIEIHTANGTDYQIRGSSTNALQIGPVTDPASRTFWVDGEGIVLGRSSQTGAPSVLFDDDTGYLKAGSFSPWTEETWHAVTFQNAFGNIGAGFHDVEYQRNALGRVELRGGALRVGATADGTALFTLPAGYRPTTTVGMVVHNLGTSSAIHPRIRVFTTGVVACYGYSAGGIANTAFAMDGLSFPLEA